MNLSEEKSKLEAELKKETAAFNESSFQVKLLTSKIKKLDKLIKESNEVLNDKGTGQDVH